MACLREPYPPVDGCKKEEINISPPQGWLFQEMLCKTDGPFYFTSSLPLPHYSAFLLYFPSDSIKRTGIQTPIRWYFGDPSTPSSQAAGFPNKVAFLASTPRLPIY